MLYKKKFFSENEQIPRLCHKSTLFHGRVELALNSTVACICVFVHIRRTFSATLSRRIRKRPILTLKDLTSKKCTPKSN